MDSSKFSTWPFMVLLVASLVLVGHLLLGFLTPAVMSLVIVSIFYPMHQKILRFLGHRHNSAAFLSTLVVFLCVLGPFILFLVTLTQQAMLVYQTTQTIKDAGGIAKWMSSLDDYLRLATAYLAGFGIHLTAKPILSLATTISQGISNGIYAFIAAVAVNVASMGFYFILTLVLVFVFFSHGRPTKRFVMDLVPIPYNEQERLVSRFRELASAIFLGTGLISALEGALGALIFFLFDIPGALIWGVFMTVTAFLPAIGAFIVVVPATIYLFLVDDPWKALLFLALNAIHISILETMVKTRLIGTKSQMNAVLVFLSILAGVQIYGMPGLFYGPLLVTIFLSLSQIYKEHYRDVLMNKS